MQSCHFYRPIKEVKPKYSLKKKLPLFILIGSLIITLPPVIVTGVSNGIAYLSDSNDYKNGIDNYESIIETLFVKLNIYANINNPFQIFSLISTMNNQGVFIPEEIYDENQYVIRDSIVDDRLSFLSGYGNDIAANRFLTDLFIRFGYNASEFICYPKDRKDVQMSCVMIYYEGNYFLFDLQTNSIYTPNDDAYRNIFSLDEEIVLPMYESYESSLQNFGEFFNRAGTRYSQTSMTDINNARALCKDIETKISGSNRWLDFVVDVRNSTIDSINTVSRVLYDKNNIKEEKIHRLNNR